MHVGKLGENGAISKKKILLFGGAAACAEVNKISDTKWGHVFKKHIFGCKTFTSLLLCR